MMRVRIAALLLLLLTACGNQLPAPESTQAPAAPGQGAAPRIESVMPGHTRAGVVFNKQPSGIAAFSILGSGFVAGAVVTANGTKLETTFGNDRLVTAVMPAELYAYAGRIAIQVTNPDGATTNALDFEVQP